MSSSEENLPYNNLEQHRFELKVGDQLAIADYQLHGGRIRFTHTKVPASLQGKGVGAKLVKFALDESRTMNYRVVPHCSFVAQYVKRHPEYADLVD